ncbi:MAG: hypothetical protein ACK55I_39495, partial [bacterium]
TRSNRAERIPSPTRPRLAGNAEGLCHRGRRHGPDDDGLRHTRPDPADPRGFPESLRIGL